LTSCGCQNLSDNKLFIPLAYRLVLEYHAPFSVPNTLGPLDGLWANIGDSQDLDEHGNDELDHSYTEQVIMEPELEEVPKIWRCKDQVLKCLNVFLPILILEDLNSADSKNVSSEMHRQIEESFQFFFCNPESIAKCRNTPRDIEKQVESWN
jgi:hypothetical protein